MQQIILNGIEASELLSQFREIVRNEIQALPKPEKVKLFLTIDEVAELTDLARQTIYSMTSAKKIPHVKRGGKLLFNRAEIIEWLQEGKQVVES